MAKNIIKSTFDEAVCPVPDQKSNDWGGNMGEPISEGQKETPWELGTTQFVDIEGGKAGSKGFGPGGKK